MSLPFLYFCHSLVGVTEISHFSLIIEVNKCESCVFVIVSLRFLYFSLLTCEVEKCSYLITNLPNHWSKWTRFLYFYPCHTTLPLCFNHFLVCGEIALVANHWSKLTLLSLCHCTSFVSVTHYLVVKTKWTRDSFIFICVTLRFLCFNHSLVYVIETSPSSLFIEVNERFCHCASFLCFSHYSVRCYRNFMEARDLGMMKSAWLLHIVILIQWREQHSAYSEQYLLRLYCLNFDWANGVNEHCFCCLIWKVVQFCSAWSQ